MGKIIKVIYDSVFEVHYMSLDKELDIKSRLNKVKDNYYRGV